MAVESKDITHGELHFNLVTPDKAKANGAGIVILPTIYGLNKIIRDIAQRVGNDGYTVLLWDCFAGTPPAAATDREGALAMAAKIKDDWATRQMTGCAAYLRDNLGMKKVGALGYCLGGRHIFLLGAADQKLAATAAVYASVSEAQAADTAAKAKATPCPVLLAYPGKDAVTRRAEFDTVQTALQARAGGNAVTLSLLYPEADHGFYWRNEPANLAAAKAGWPVLDGFFKAYLT